uniref:glutathione transferase n=1 Tax=Photinus pyralis TaxID=7054 RepID=A0A1Y1LMT7_PHOPY
MSLKLYYDALSQPSRALLIFLKTTNIPFTGCVVNIGKGEHLTEQYKNEVSPFQKVPVIIHGDFHLTESVGILRYLCREFSVPDHFYPKDSKLQARVDEYLEWQHNNIRAGCAMYFRNKWLMPKITGEPSNEKTLAKYKCLMVDSIDTFERCWLQSNAFIAGDKISAADIWAACELEQPRMAGYDPAEGRPILSRWLSNVRAELNPYYEEAHKFLNKIVQLESKVVNAKL